MNDINNTIYLKGIIKDIQPSHIINNTEFSKAKLLVKRSDKDIEDVLNLRFKTYTNPYKDNDAVELVGNIRSYSSEVNGKHKVTIYVFTYFDDISKTEVDMPTDNVASLEGRICKINELRTTRTGKHNIHFILANNIMTDDGHNRLNSYIPCIAWGKTAKELSKLSVSSKLKLTGELHSREHKKVHEDGSIELRVAHEFVVSSFEVLE